MTLITSRQNRHWPVYQVLFIVRMSKELRSFSGKRKEARRQVRLQRQLYRSVQRHEYQDWPMKTRWKKSRKTLPHSIIRVSANDICTRPLSYDSSSLNGDNTNATTIDVFQKREKTYPHLTLKISRYRSRTADTDISACATTRDVPKRLSRNTHWTPTSSFYRGVSIDPHLHSS